MHYSRIIRKFQLPGFSKNPGFVLALILATFLLKGIFLAALFPIFVGQDEARHYNSLQFLAEPRPITWKLNERKEPSEDTLQRYNYSQEIKETAKATGFDEFSDEIYLTPDFSDGFNGKNENEINAKKWHNYNEYYPVNTAGKSLYHQISSFLIEKPLASQNILVRYFAARLFSVLLGTLTVLISFFIIKNIGFAAKTSLLLTAIIAFQPRFSIYHAAINYDALLILLFAIFTLGGILALKKGLDWKSPLMMIAPIVLGVWTKATASVLLIAFLLLLGYFIFQKVRGTGKLFKTFVFLLFAFSMIAALGFLKKYLPEASYDISTVFTSVSQYLTKSLTLGRFSLTSRTYWGGLGWTDNFFINNIDWIIWAVEFFSLIGLAIYFGSKKKLEYLPEKKYVLFLIFMVILLQFEIRFADWMYFHRFGSLETGTPGRYFLPNIASHIILAFTGIGALLKKKEYFEKSVLLGFLLMLTYMIYIIFDTIIYRYYL